MRALWNHGDLELIAGPNRKGETSDQPSSSPGGALHSPRPFTSLHGGPALSSSLVTSGEAMGRHLGGLTGLRLSGRPEDLGDPGGRPQAGDRLLKDIVRVVERLESLQAAR